MKNIKIACTSINNKLAQESKNILCNELGIVDIDLHKNFQPDLLIVMGGDGALLHAIHNFNKPNICFLGINFGNLGFLMNPKSTIEKLKNFQADNFTCIQLSPLEIQGELTNGEKFNSIAFNELSLFRQSHQTSKIRILVNDIEEMSELIGDGILVATAAGSTAYNSSVGGPTLPLTSNLLALTPISPFRPKRWKGALLPNNLFITLEIIDHDKRPVSAAADFHLFSNVKKIIVNQHKSLKAKILFEKDNDLNFRMIKEQFAY